MVFYLKKQKTKKAFMRVSDLNSTTSEKAVQFNFLFFCDAKLTSGDDNPSDAPDVWKCFSLFALCQKISTDPRNDCEGVCAIKTHEERG